MANKTITHYKITSKLDQDGMGEVYLATAFVYTLLKGVYNGEY